MAKEKYDRVVEAVVCWAICALIFAKMMHDMFTSIVERY
jgi:hypothetical protein